MQTCQTTVPALDFVPKRPELMGRVAEHAALSEASHRTHLISRPIYTTASNPSHTLQPLTLRQHGPQQL